MENPYVIRQTEIGYYVARLVSTGGFLTVDGPYLTRYEAEVAARKRWNSGHSRKAA